MPDNLMNRFPCALNHLEAIKVPLRAGTEFLDQGIRSLSLGFDLNNNFQQLGFKLTHRWYGLFGGQCPKAFNRFNTLQYRTLKNFYGIFKNLWLHALKQIHREKRGELEFISLFTEPLPVQDWTESYDPTRILLELPSLRVIDVSAEVKHALHNYTVVFAPRAGHHSNIAERVALYLREQGLSRMVIVEQKCADDIPLYVNQTRHRENFDSQIDQYKQVLAHLKDLSGYPSHLIAICQPGPLLMSTLILNPHLGKTFGSAGSPMHTEAEKGVLTDFARLMGENYIDELMRFCGHTITSNCPGHGRQSFDGAQQVLGFYYLGMDQHVRNFKQLLRDLKQGNTESAKRQMAFYRWYHTVHHFPAGFIQDTYKKIFVKNDLIRGALSIGNKIIGIKDYPGHVPIWALGGSNDKIAPALQATGHLELINSVSDDDKLNLICSGGHMGLFRSEKILKTAYSKIAAFILERSDRITTV
jgi:poly(3-hydroxybutyrate) depolymerase